MWQCIARCLPQPAGASAQLHPRVHAQRALPAQRAVPPPPVVNDYEQSLGSASELPPGLASRKRQQDVILDAARKRVAGFEFSPEAADLRKIHQKETAKPTLPWRRKSGPDRQLKVGSGGKLLLSARPTGSASPVDGGDARRSAPTRPPANGSAPRAPAPTTSVVSSKPSRSDGSSTARWAAARVAGLAVSAGAAPLPSFGIFSGRYKRPALPQAARRPVLTHAVKPATGSDEESTKTDKTDESVPSSRSGSFQGRLAPMTRLEVDRNRWDEKFV